MASIVPKVNKQKNRAFLDKANKDRVMADPRLAAPDRAKKHDAAVAEEWKPLPVLQAINFCLCLMYVPYLLTATLTRWHINLWLAAVVSILVGTGLFILAYRRTKDVRLFKFE